MYQQIYNGSFINKTLSSLIVKAIITLITIALMAGCGPGLGSEPPLHDAAFRGDAEKVKALLDSGIDVNSLNSEGATPLHWAAFKGHLDVAKVLIRHGARVNAKTKKGSTPLRLATTHKKDELIRYLKMMGGKI